MNRSCHSPGAPVLMMEKRAIIAIGLSILVFILFQYLQQKRQGGKVPVRSSTPIQRQVQEAAKKPPQAPVKAPAPPAESEPVTVPRSAEDTEASAQTVIVEGGIYRAVLDNRGAVLTSWELKDYKSGQNQVFEMIAGPRAGESRTYPGSLILPDPAMGDLANESFYQVSIEGEHTGDAALHPPVTVVLKLRRGDLSVEKRYRFEAQNYVVDLSTDCRLGGKPLQGRFFLGQDIGPEQEHLLSSSKLQAVYYSDGKVRRESPPKDQNEAKKIEGDVRWVGLDMHYFALIAIPDHSLKYFDIQKHPVKAIGLDGKEVDRDLLKVTTPVDGPLDYQIYLGPKKQSNLQAVRAADITGVINYGMFSILVHPLLASLRWTYQYVHNYGYAIIILTFFLSILLFPLRLKQMISMKKMQAVQPRVKAIQDKYRRYKKTDPKRAEMNQEIMALYKEHNVNPLGGCLPMIVQMPLLFAFYSLLMNSIELRQAPFVWWIHDLSLKDPYYVVPIIMGITMFISQKMTPMTPGADPTQAKMMMLMPAVFTIMFINLSSGLNLYFLCSNIFQVAFQKIAERWIGDGKSRSKAKT